MNKNEAIQHLDQLIQIDIPSIDEVVEGFKIALSLGDRLQAVYFQRLYATMMYDLFWDAALTITKQESVDFFMKHFTSWKRLYCGQLRSIHMTIILQQKDKIKNFALLNDTIFQVSFSVLGIEQLGWIDKSVNELKAFYDDEVRKCKEETIYECLALYALASNDVALIKKILHELPAINSWYDNLYEHMVKVIAKTDFEEAIHLLKSITSENDKQRIKYYLAKMVYTDDLECANALLAYNTQGGNYGIEAFIAVQNGDEAQIRSIIKFLDSELEFEHIDEDEYDQGIFSIGFEIADTYPLIAMELIDKAHVRWGDLFDMQFTVSAGLFLHASADRALEYFDNMNDELCQMMALMEVAEKADDPELLILALSKADAFESIKNTYFIYEEVYKKKPIEFERMYGVISQLLPLEVDFHEPEEVFDSVEKYLF